MATLTSVERPYLLAREGAFDWSHDPLVWFSPTLSRDSRSERKLFPDGFVEIGKGTADALNLNGGRQVRLTSVHGESVVQVRVKTDLKPGLLSVPMCSIVFPTCWAQRGPEQSGKAVLARQKQSDISTFGFGDNLARAMRFAGRQLVDLIPKIYDQPRLQRIVNPDGTVDHAVIHNGPNQLAGARALATQSFPGHSDPYTKIYDLSVGTYDVVVSVGPSYQTKRQEAAAAQIELIKAFPNIMAVAGDILVGNQDWPGAREIAKRMKALLPPALQDDPDADPETRLAQAQGQIQSLSQQHQALTVELNKMSDILRSKRFELESKERIALMQIQGQLVVADLKAHVDGAMQLLQAQTRAIEQRLALLHESQSIDTEAAGGVPIQTPAVPPALTSSLHAGPGAPIAPTAQGPGGQP